MSYNYINTRCFHSYLYFILPVGSVENSILFTMMTSFVPDLQTLRFPKNLVSTAAMQSLNMIFGAFFQQYIRVTVHRLNTSPTILVYSLVQVCSALNLRQNQLL